MSENKTQLKSPEQVAKAKADIKEILGMHSKSTEDSELSRVLDEVLSEKDIEGKSELNRNQIVAFAKAAWYADHYDSDAMRVIILKLLKFLKSKDRQGLKELTGMITGLFQYQIEKTKAEKVEL